MLPCVADGLLIRLMLPRTSDLLLNIEREPQVLVTSSDWQVWGRARVLDSGARAALINGFNLPDPAWFTLIEVVPARVAVSRHEGWGAAETFDVDAES